MNMDNNNYNPFWYDFVLRVWVDETYPYMMMY